MRRIVVAGASRGIGAAVAAHFAGQGCDVIALSRSEARSGRWIGCDLSDPVEIARVAVEIGAEPVDALIYAGGIWEDGAFVGDYRFEESGADEIAAVLAVNLTGPILLTGALLPALRRAAPGRAIFVGSLDGLDNNASVEVANAASKYGLRGAAQAMDRGLRGSGLAVTVINPGNVGTDEVLEDIAEGRFGPQDPIPIPDLIAAMEFALSLSPASVVTEINLDQMRVQDR